MIRTALIPLLFTPLAAHAAPQCSAAVALAASSPTPVEATKSTSQNEPAATARPFTATEVAVSPALSRLASHGASLSDLGSTHGLQTVFAKNGQRFQVFYVTPDQSAVIGGVMWDATGHNITRDQVAPIQGTIPTVKNGEVIILFGGRRIYARLFYADIKPGGAMRVRQGVTGIVAMPAAEAVDEHAVAVRDKIVGGMDVVRPEDLTAPTEPVLAAALSAFAAALAAGVGPDDETRRILAAVSAVQTASAPIQQAKATGPAATEAPWHPYGEMLASVTEPGPFTRPSPLGGTAHDPDHVNLIMAIETRNGLSTADARFNALCILDSLDRAPPPANAS